MASPLAKTPAFGHQRFDEDDEDVNDGIVDDDSDDDGGEVMLTLMINVMTMIVTKYGDGHDDHDDYDDNGNDQICVNSKLALLKGPDSHPLEGAIHSTVVDDVVPVNEDCGDNGHDVSRQCDDI